MQWPASFDGEPNVKGVLDCEGVMRTFPMIAGLVFRVAWNDPKYLGLIRTKGDEVAAMMADFCHMVNDADNSFEAQLTGT